MNLPPDGDGCELGGQFMSTIVPVEILVSVLAPSLVAVAGGALAWLTGKVRRENSQDVAKIANAVSSEALLARDRAIEKFLEKTPAGTSLNEIVTSYRQMAAGDINIQINQAEGVGTTGWQLVEGLVNGYHTQP